MSPSQQPASPGQRLIIISGEEGAGKSAIVRALLPNGEQVITRYTLGQLLDKLDELTGERES